MTSALSSAASSCASRTSHRAVSQPSTVKYSHSDRSGRTAGSFSWSPIERSSKEVRGAAHCLKLEQSPQRGRLAWEGDHHSKNTIRSNGQKRRITLPMMLATGTGPKVRESDENVRLSPITKICPCGTVNG